jgi:hypothetical protein
MLLKFKQDDALIEVQDIKMLMNPSEPKILGRIQSGEEEQDTSDYGKVDLLFLSGESLPRCWIDGNYREA